MYGTHFLRLTVLLICVSRGQIFINVLIFVQRVRHGLGYMESKLPAHLYTNTPHGKTINKRAELTSYIWNHHFLDQPMTGVDSDEVILLETREKDSLMNKKIIQQTSVWLPHGDDYYWDADLVQLLKVVGDLVHGIGHRVVQLQGSLHGMAAGSQSWYQQSSGRTDGRTDRKKD